MSPLYTRGCGITVLLTLQGSVVYAMSTTVSLEHGNTEMLGGVKIKRTVMAGAPGSHDRITDWKCWGFGLGLRGAPPK